MVRVVDLVEELLAGSRPRRRTGHHLSRPAICRRTREGPHVDLGPSGVVGVVRQPPPVGRKGRTALGGSAIQERDGFARLPSRGCVALHRQNHDVEGRPRILFLQGEELAGRMPRGGPLWVLAFGQPFRLARAIRPLPIEVPPRPVRSVGSEGDATAVRCPHRRLIHRRGRRSGGTACRAPTRRPTRRAAVPRRCRWRASDHRERSRCGSGRRSARRGWVFPSRSIQRICPLTSTARPGRNTRSLGPKRRSALPANPGAAATPSSAGAGWPRSSRRPGSKGAANRRPFVHVDEVAAR